MDEHPLRRLEPARKKERRPVDRVEAEDVLADQVQVRGPEAVGQVHARPRVAERRDVVEEGVEPHVHDLALVPRQGHAPAELRPRERDVLQAGLDEREGLVAAEVRAHEVRTVGVEAAKVVLERRQPEEPVLLPLEFERDLVDRTRVAGTELGLGVKRGAAGAVPTLVDALVHVAVVVHGLHDLLDARDVRGVGGADEEVVRDIDRRHQRLEALGVSVGELLRRDPLTLGRLRDRLAVLVRAGEEEDVLAPLAHVAGENVGGDRGVRVAEVGLGVDVVDRGRYVVRHRGSENRQRRANVPEPPVERPLRDVRHLPPRRPTPRAEDGRFSPAGSPGPSARGAGAGCPRPP